VVRSLSIGFVSPYDTCNEIRTRQTSLVFPFPTRVSHRQRLSLAIYHFLLRVPTMRRKVLRHRRNQVATMRLIDQGRLRAVKRQTIFTVDSLCIRPFFYRAMLCIRGTRHGPVSVRLSVRPSHVGVLLKRLNVGSHKQHRTIVQRL